MNKDINEFWNERATFGEHAGTNDFILKQLELKEMIARIPDGAHVLDVGSGNGETLCLLAEKKGCTGVGIDFAEKLVLYANGQVYARNLSSKIKFQQGNILHLSDDLGLFDIVVTERCMINLADNTEQKSAFDSLLNRLKSGGSFLMFENSVQGLSENNKLRSSLGVELMEAPWHNHYFDENEVQGWESEGVKLDGLFHFSSTYHFLSRVVYAKLAKDSGEELAYDSPINLLSVDLPPMGTFGPTKLWVWTRKNEGSGDV